MKPKPHAAVKHPQPPKQVNTKGQGSKIYKRVPLDMQASASTVLRREKMPTTLELVRGRVDTLQKRTAPQTGSARPIDMDLRLACVELLAILIEGLCERKFSAAARR